MGNESQESLTLVTAEPKDRAIAFNPIKTNVIITAGMSAGLLASAYFVDAAGAKALKDVLILVSGGLMALAGTMAADPVPDAFRAYLDYKMNKYLARKDREPRINN